jgi:hypothetical protein
MTTDRLLALHGLPRLVRALPTNVTGTRMRRHARTTTTYAELEG